MTQLLANIHPNAKIGNNVTIEPFATIYGDVVIGDDSWIGPNAVIMDGARIGKGVKIFPGAVVSSVPQDLKFNGEITTTEIGDYSTIRECVTISRGTVDKFKTIIGSHCLIMAYVHIAHDCIIGDHCIIANAVQLAGHVEIGNYVNIGGLSAARQFVKIGSYVMIAGGSLVRKDVPPYTMAAREPLMYCGLNIVGLRRRGFTNDKIGEIQEIYRYVYQRGLNNSMALKEVESNIANSKERTEIIDFIRSSERGIMKGDDD